MFDIATKTDNFSNSDYKICILYSQAYNFCVLFFNADNNFVLATKSPSTQDVPDQLNSSFTLSYTLFLSSSRISSKRGFTCLPKI